MQYVTYIEGQYRTLKNSLTGLYVRMGQRNKMLVRDAELIPNGFSEPEGTGWVNFYKSDYVCNGTKIRQGVRDTDYVEDAEIINGVGFNGTENTDWDNMQEISSVMRDGHTIAWYDGADIPTITKNESNVVSKIADKLGSGNDQITGSCGWHSDKYFTFDGLTQYMKSGTWATKVQPLKVYFVFRSNRYQPSDCFFDGRAVSLSLVYGTSNPALQISGASGKHSGVPESMGQSLYTWGIIKALYNGVNGKFQIDDNIIGTGDFGSNSITGFTLGSNYAQTFFGKMDLKEVIIRDAEIDDSIIVNYLKRKDLLPHRFNKGKVLLTWDGDLTSIPLGWPLLSAKNFKHTLYLCQNFGGAGMEITWNQIAAEHATGRLDLENHGYTHVKFTDETTAEVSADLQNMINGQIAHGYDYPHHCAYPFGNIDETRKPFVAALQLTGRGIRECQIQGTKTDRYDLPSYNIGDATNIDTIKAQIDYAIANKTAMTMYCHGLPVGTPVVAIYQAILDYLVGKDIDVITMSELSGLLE